MGSVCGSGGISQKPFARTKRSTRESNLSEDDVSEQRGASPTPSSGNGGRGRRGSHNLRRTSAKIEVGGRTSKVRASQLPRSPSAQRSVLSGGKSTPGKRARSPAIELEDSDGDNSLPDSSSRAHAAGYPHGHKQVRSKEPDGGADACVEFGLEDCSKLKPGEFLTKKRGFKKQLTTKIASYQVRASRSRAP